MTPEERKKIRWSKTPPIQVGAEYHQPGTDMSVFKGAFFMRVRTIRGVVSKVYMTSRGWRCEVQTENGETIDWRADSVMQWVDQ